MLVHKNWIPIFLVGQYQPSNAEGATNWDSNTSNFKYGTAGLAEYAVRSQVKFGGLASGTAGVVTLGNNKYVYKMIFANPFGGLYTLSGFNIDNESGIFESTVTTTGQQPLINSTYSSTLATQFEKTGSGYLAFGAAVTHSKNWLVSAGFLTSRAGNIGGSSALGQNNTITLLSGTELRILLTRGSSTVLGLQPSNNIVSTDATISFTSLGGTNAYDGCYSGNMTLSGSLVDTSTGDGPRFGYTYGSRTITTTGTLSAINTPMWLVNNVASPTLTFDTGVDLDLDGAITDYPGLTGMPIIKNGTASLNVFAGWSIAGSVTINNGRIKCFATSVLSATSSYVLANVAGVGIDLFNSNQTINALSGGGTTGGTITGTSGSSLTISAPGGLTYAGIFTGALNITKAGGSNLSLTGASTATGTTTIQNGVLIYDTGGTTPNARIHSISSGATLRKTGATAQTWTGAISGAGTLQLNFTGDTLSINSNNTSFTGPVNMTAAGTTRVQGTSPLGSGQITISASGTFASRSTGVAVTIPNPVAINSGITLGCDGGWNTVTFSGVISNSGNFTSTSSGLVVISGASNTNNGTISTQTASNAVTMINGNWAGAAVARSAGILQGLGTITGLTTVNSGGKIAGGDFKGTGIASYTYTTTNATGTLTCNGGLTFAALASRLIVYTNGTTNASLVSVTGSLTAASGFTVDILGALNTGVYTLISNTGTLPGTTPTLGTNSSGRTVVLSWSAGVGLIATLT